MTDARYPDRWLHDRRLLRLSADDFRSFLVALVWSVSNRTDGRMDADDLRLIPGFREESVSALTAADLWRYAGDGWQITDFAATQTSKSQLEGLEDKKRADRERQARKRARDRGQEPPVSSRDNPRDIARDTQARQGQARARRSKGEGVREGSNGHVFDEHDADFVAAREAL